MMRVLVVDDDRSVLRMLEYSLQKLGPGYEIATAKDMFSAIEKIEQQWFDLVLTDYMMPGMTGVDLARAVHRISPDTQIILMTAYGTSKLRNTTNHIGFDGFIEKPFDLDDLYKLVKQVKQRTHSEKQPETAPASGSSDSAAASDPDQKSDEPQSPDVLLENLLINIGARAVILITAEGDPVKVVGQLDSIKATQIASLVAVNFLRTEELSTLIDNKKIFRSGFYEGDAYNIYICDVNEKSLLAVIFDVRLRPGVVWFYTKQTASSLAPLLT